jgi:hypothetical protein
MKSGSPDYSNALSNRREATEPYIIALTLQPTLGYKVGRHFISHDAADIMEYLIGGIISLVIVYRDHMGGIVYPLLPWLHSSETCEHVFAECRKLIKDFTFLDFLYMLPRLHVLIRATVHLSYTSDPKARAQGYAHMYLDADGVNNHVLSQFPMDEEITVAAKEAWDESDSLFTLLGVSPSEFMHAPDVQPTSLRLPSIDSWFSPGQDPILGQYPRPMIDDDEDDSGSEGDGETDSDADISEAVELQRLIDEEERISGRTNATDDKMLNLALAAIAVNVNDGMLA